MAYADDILITALTKQSLMDTFQQLKNYLLEVGLTINGEENKVFKVHQKRHQDRELKYKEVIYRAGETIQISRVRHKRH